MTILLNGRAHTVVPGMTLADLIASMELPAAGIAIAVNSEVVRGPLWSETGLAEDDVVDIVTARQGG